MNTDARLLEKSGIVIKSYHKIYAKRHNLTPLMVASVDWCDLAAQLEYLMGIQRLTVSQARRRFVQQYPKANCIQSYRDINNKLVASVLDIIRPYDNSIWY